MYKKIKAFTLLEIIIIITLIGIIAIGASNISFNKLSDRQKIDGFFYKIKTNIENIQNNALLGKAIKNGAGSELIVPKKWKIDFNNSGLGKIVSNYSIDGNNFIKYNEIIPKKHYSIKISNNGNLLINTGSLIIQGGEMSLSGITTNSKNLTININYKEFKKSFTINTISGVIQEN